MIVLVQNALNEVVMTLTEKASSAATTSYLFVLTCDQELGKEYKCVAEDTSEFPERYNRFTLSATTDSSNPNQLNGELYLPLRGTYRYTVYEQTSTTNLDTALTNGVVERGKVLVKYNPLSDIRHTLTGSTAFDIVTT